MKLYHKARSFIRRISSYHVSLYAANASFYIILSVFPAIMLVLSLLPYTSFSEEDLLSAINSVIPSILEPLFAYIVKDLSGSATGALVSISALVAIWSSSRGVYCIQVGLNAICGTKESRSYVHMRLISMCYMVLLIAALLLTLAINVFGHQLSAYLLEQSLPVVRFWGHVLQFRGLILLFLLSALFTAIFCVFPNRKSTPRRTFPGALAAAFGWLAFSSLFSYYVRNFGDYSVFYGSLSTIAIGMLWLYICISILFYGGVLNQLLDQRKR